MKIFTTIKKILVLKSAILYQDYFPLGKLRTIKGAVTLYASAGYKLRFSLWPYNVTRRIVTGYIIRLVTLYGSTPLSRPTKDPPPRLRRPRERDTLKQCQCLVFAGEGVVRRGVRDIRNCIVLFLWSTWENNRLFNSCSGTTRPIAWEYIF